MSLPEDTTPEAARVQEEVLRRMTPGQRLEIAFRMSGMVREMSRERIRAHHPEFSEQQVTDELIWELYGIRVGPR